MIESMAKRRRRGVPAWLLAVSVALAFAAGTSFGYVLLKLPSAEQGPPAWLTGARESTIKIAAVRSDGPGIICKLRVRLTPGEGRIWVDTHPLVGFDFQYSERIAVAVASRLTGAELDEDGIGLRGIDVAYVVVPPPEGAVEVQAIDGPSAGAAITLATIAAIENARLREDFVITGTIREDGAIGQVGGIFEKAKAANDAGARLFLVPPGQSVVTAYREVVRELGPFRWVTYEPVRVDLNKYAENAGWDLEIKEVSDIEDALKLALV